MIQSKTNFCFKPHFLTIKNIITFVKKQKHINMKKLVLVSLVILAFTFGLNAQNVQLDNPGFEEWEDVGVGQDEPVSWSTIKTSDNQGVNNVAPITWARCDTAHSGNYSVKLINLTTIINQTATGSVTNGRFHTTYNPTEGYVFTDPEDDQWHKPFTGRPDSVAVWIQFYPVNNDTLQAKFLLHKNEGTLAIKPENEDNVIALASINLTGVYDEWTRVTAPFVYESDENPEYILAMPTSGAGLNAIAVSMALYDDIELIYGPQAVGDNLFANSTIYYADGNIWFKNLPADIGESSVEIIDLSGKIIIKEQITTDHIAASDSGLKPGIYIARIINEKSSFSTKLFVK